jgi:hypothetical protein
MSVSGTRKKIKISGARNSENGSAIFLGAKTDIMVQFLAPETDVMERNFMFSFILILLLPFFGCHSFCLLLSLRCEHAATDSS